MEVSCPRCKKFVQYEGNPHRPFCSDRCRIMDLGQWATEKYAVPTEDSGSEQSQQETLEEDKSSDSENE